MADFSSRIMEAIMMRRQWNDTLKFYKKEKMKQNKTQNSYSAVVMAGAAATIFKDVTLKKK